MKIKICGLTTLDDAQIAAEAGADMLGFVFYPKSPRYISPTNCSSLVERLFARGFPIVTVGVFVNVSVGSVREILDSCGLHLAQLHGDETPNELKALNSRAFKAIRPRTADEAREAIKRYAGVGVSAPALLLDAYEIGHYGGTGSCADWNIAEELARATPLMLAGGLTPENVTKAMARVQPWGVDVSSGVECSPGKKDWQKVDAFVRAVRQYEKEKAV